MTYLVEIIERAVDAQLKMLGRDLVRDLDSTVKRVGNDDLAVVVDRCSCDLSSLEQRDLPLQLSRNSNESGLVEDKPPIRTASLKDYGERELQRE